MMASSEVSPVLICLMPAASRNLCPSAWVLPTERALGGSVTTVMVLPAGACATIAWPITTCPAVLWVDMTCLLSLYT